MRISATPRTRTRRGVRVRLVISRSACYQCNEKDLICGGRERGGEDGKGKGDAAPFQSIRYNGLTKREPRQKENDGASDKGLWSKRGRRRNPLVLLRPRAR